ncbi:MAG: hypothetical protein RLO54_05495 [Sandaracinaceae bacterium]
MRHAHFACLALLLVAGCAEESATCAAGEIRSPDGVCVPDTDLDAATLDAGEDAGADAGDADTDPCEGRCLADELCDSDGRCVDCLADADCDAPTNPVCNDVGECVAGCTSNATCARFEATPACDEGGGTCVECDADDASQCGASESCDLIDFTCVPQETRRTCETCTNDDQCPGGHLCVTMTYEGLPRGVGGYCLQTTADAGVCPRPFQNERDASSLNDPTTRVEVCSIFEDLQTCEAVRALIDDRLCTGDGACQNSMGAFVPVEGALCRNLGGEMRCTVRRSGAVSCEPVDGTSASECISGYCDTP